MTISRNEEWVQIAALDEQDQVRFTDEFQAIMGRLGWDAQQFVGHVLGLWNDPFEHMLDYNSGDAKFTQDQPGEYANNTMDEPQEVVEYWAERWDRNPNAYSPTHEAGTGLDLGVEWYRDVLRAKLVSIRLPKRLLLTYKVHLIAKLRELGSPLVDFEED